MVIDRCLFECLSKVVNKETSVFPFFYNFFFLLFFSSHILNHVEVDMLECRTFVLMLYWSCVVSIEHFNMHMRLIPLLRTTYIIMFHMRSIPQLRICSLLFFECRVYVEAT